MLKSSDPYFSKTIEKGLIVLNLFDRDHPRRSLTEISKLTGINKTSTYRFVNTLVRLGYLRKSDNKLLKLGPRALVLGHNFVQGFDLLQAVKPMIDKVYLECKVTIDSALFYDLQLLSLYRREASNLIYFRLPLVMRDLHARAMGKAVLAQLPADDLARFFKRQPLNRLTPKTRVKKADLLADLELIRNRGYSTNDEEYVSGMVSIGAPVMNFNKNSVAGAVSLDFPKSEKPLAVIEAAYTGILTKLASDIAEMITMAEN